MFSQFFGTYLKKSGKITAEQLSACMDYIRTNRVQLGLIAEEEGLLTRQQATELNYMQMHSDTKFGVLAIEKGYLTEADVNYLLDKQNTPFFIFVQALEVNEVMTKGEIDEALDNFQKDNNYSDEVFEALKYEDIDGFLPAFVQAEDSRYRDFIGLALRNIVRFVSSYVHIESGEFVSSITAKYIACQHTVGDYDGFLGFCCDTDDILAIADGYAKEEFDAVDEDALDAVAEFTNCVNGLHAVELSYNDINIDMLPPELLFDETIEDSEQFYALPVFIDNKKSTLIVKIGN